MVHLPSSHRLEGAPPPHIQDEEDESQEKSGHREVTPSVSTTCDNQTTYAAARVPKKMKKREYVCPPQASQRSGRHMPPASKLPQSTTLDLGSYEQWPQSVQETHRIAVVLANSGVQNTGYPPIASAWSNPAQAPSSSSVQYSTRNQDRKVPGQHVNMGSSVSQYMAYTLSGTDTGHNTSCQGPFAHELSPLIPSPTYPVPTSMRNVDRALALQMLDSYRGHVDASSRFRAPPAISVSSSTHFYSYAPTTLSESNPSYQELIFSDQLYRLKSSPYQPPTYMPIQTTDQHRGLVDASSRSRAPPALSVSSSSHSPNTSYLPSPPTLLLESVNHEGCSQYWSSSIASPSDFSFGQRHGPEQGIGSSAGILHPTDPDVQCYESTLDGFGKFSSDPQPFHSYEGYSNTTDQDN